MSESPLDQDISSANDETKPLFSKEEFGWFEADQTIPDDPGSIIDGEIVDEKPPSRLKSGRTSMLDRAAKSGIPDIDEWMHFFSKVILRLGTDYYIDRAFAGIDEDLLSDREIEKLKLTDEDRDRMARPFAEYSNKSKFMRKHGRMIVASADSIDAILALGMWVSRVQRIRAKYVQYKGKTISRKRTVVRASPVFRPSEQEQGAEFDVSSGQGAPSENNGHDEHWRPDILGQVFNPNLG